MAICGRRSPVYSAVRWPISFPNQFLELKVRYISRPITRLLQLDENPLGSSLGPWSSSGPSIFRSVNFRGSAGVMTMTRLVFEAWGGTKGKRDWTITPRGRLHRTRDRPRATTLFQPEEAARTDVGTDRHRTKSGERHMQVELPKPAWNTKPMSEGTNRPATTLTTTLSAPSPARTPASAAPRPSRADPPRSARAAAPRRASAPAPSPAAASPNPPRWSASADRS